jgi:ADP-ribose pyrophosphatase YjhB (NUDIX family)
MCVRDNRILLVARERSRWAVPGGRIRRDEAPHEAALRELEEETTLVADELMYLFQFNGFNTQHHVFFADVGPHLTAQPSTKLRGVGGSPRSKSRRFLPVCLLVASWSFSSGISAFRNRMTYGGRRSRWTG